MKKIGILNTSECCVHIRQTLMEDGMDASSANNLAITLVSLYIETWLYDLGNQDKADSYINMYGLEPMANQFTRKGSCVIYDMADHLVSGPPWQGDRLLTSVSDSAFSSIETQFKILEERLIGLMGIVDRQHHMADVNYHFDKWRNYDVQLEIDIED